MIVISKDVLLTPEQIAAEEKRWIFEAPIAEMAEVMNLSIDEAVKLRVEKNLEEAPMPIDVTVRPIEPQDILRANRMMYVASGFALAWGAAIRGFLA